MDHIEDFYFGDDENSGEAIFNRFAAKHAHIFDENSDENKLEYTAIY